MTRSYKPAALLALLVAALLLAVAFAGHVTGTQTYVNRSTTLQQLGDGITGTDTTITNRGAVVQLGNVELAATGINTKTLVYQGDACGNASMSWDDSPAGSAYKVTNHTSWNSQQAGGTICDIDGESNGMPLAATMWGPNGCSKHFPSGIPKGATIVDSQDCTGSFTTKTQWSLMEDVNHSIRYACAYLIPGGGGYWTTTNCSV